MAKFEAFVMALRELCLSHNVCLSTSEYDNLQVWNLEPGEEPLYNTIENKLEEL